MLWCGNGGALAPLLLCISMLLWWRAGVVAGLCVAVGPVDALMGNSRGSNFAPENGTRSSIKAVGSIMKFFGRCLHSKVPAPAALVPV